jgi:hypothetical protein
VKDFLICKPTRWFFERALGMLAMFLFLGGWFYRDANTGYRQQNLIFAYHATFVEAGKTYKEQKHQGISAAQWKGFAENQSVSFGDDSSLVPTEAQAPTPWPAELCEASLLEEGHLKAWEAFTGRMKWNRKPPEKWHDAGSIREQWIVGHILMALAAITLFLLLRTLRRTMVLDGDTIITQDGRKVPIADLTQLDLRKWYTKGLAFAEYQQKSGKKGRIRIDGMTYGGFQKEKGEPAEQWMTLVRKQFHGELIEYASEETEEQPTEP